MRDLDATILSALSATGLTETARFTGGAVEGYFRDEYVEMDTGDSLVEARQITFDCRAEDLPQVRVDDPVTITRGNQQLGEFRVAQMRPVDGSGRRLIYLGPYV